MSQVQNTTAALSGSLLSKKPHSTLPQSLGIPPTAGPLPSEHAGRPHQSSALPPASVTAGNAAAALALQYYRSSSGIDHRSADAEQSHTDFSLLERAGEDRPNQSWRSRCGGMMRSVVHFMLCVLCLAESITPTVELNALCMKLGRKPAYKPLDPYTGMRSPYSYNMRGGGYPPRYFYPFPMAPMLYQVELSIGGQQFHGKGRTRQAAKHDAAAKALKFLQHEPLPSKPESWRSRCGGMMRSVVHFMLCVLCLAESITPTVELNALCMKLGRKPAYKPLDPYTGMRSPYSYNMRGGGYPPRYFYPFPMAPMLYQVELSIGGQQFHGKGRTRQAAKHDAAAKALKFLQHEPLPSKPEMNGKASDEENLNKSEISQVFEIALKRNLPVNFE
ncbi:PREDICTED: double-stranded RNA-binding protein Staufen homolog 1-like, partial [Nanorana parkeri]|uniref:double-stranded RNA-binding protein Staufen homolog 1-like n=1 Tax=Nanorana parkeri TaxID=125878 RepID=UPI000854B29E